jgi:hypothetical protein
MTGILFRPHSEQISVCLPPVPQPEPEQGYDQRSAQQIQVAGALKNSNEENYAQIKLVVSEFVIFYSVPDLHRSFFVTWIFFVDPDPDVKTVEIR